MGDGCDYRLQFDTSESGAERWGVADGWRCPHESYADADHCLFHLSSEEREQRGVDDEDLVEALREVAASRGKEAKQLLGARFDDLDVEHEIVEAADNHPLDLRFATVAGTLGFHHAEVDPPVDLRGAEVGSIDWETARFCGPVDLAGLVVDGETALRATVFEDDVTLLGATFDGEVDFREARFHGDTCLCETRFERTAAFDGVEFRGDANLVDDDVCFECADFVADVSFTMASFRYADFVGCRFGGTVEFDEASFAADAEFAATTFEEPASFRGTEFVGGANVVRDDADFSEARFRDAAAFEQAEFSHANFTDATFASRVGFEGVAFDEEAEFADATFGDDVAFVEARFHDDADFSGVVAEGDVTFLGAEFHGGDNVESEDASFESVTFRGHAEFANAYFRAARFANVRFASTDFHAATFDRDTTFEAARFGGPAAFDEARFGGDSSFEKAGFEAEATFRGAEFEGGDNVDDDDLSFRNGVFEGPVDFLRARFRFCDFSGAAFERDATFDEAAFDRDAVFTGVRFGDTTSFERSVFHDEGRFDGASFEDESSFRGASFAGERAVDAESLTFAGATFAAATDFRRAAFESVTFEETVFDGRARFDETRFQGDTEFSAAAFAGRATFDEARFANDASFQEAEFDERARFRGVEFHGGDNVRDDDVTFAGATFALRADFERAVYEFANYTSVTFAGPANFESAEFGREGRFRESEFRAETTFAEARFTDDADFEECTFHDDVSFLGVEFEGGSHEDDDAAFSRATFERDADFSEVEFRQAGFDDARVGGRTSFHRSRFGVVHADDARFDGPVDLSFTRFDEPATFEGTTFASSVDAKEGRFESDACFASVTFEQDVSFVGTEFTGGAHTVDDADFEAAAFSDTADFRMAEFRFANFVGADFGGNALFENTLFRDTGTFQNAAFGASAVFSRTRFVDEADFSSCRFADEAHFDELRFEKDTTFADAVFEGDATFRATEFEGSANMHNDDASFEGAAFRATADFDKASFLYANFTHTTFERRGCFTGVEFAHSVVFRPRPADSEALVDLTGAVLNGGTVGQPETGEVFYDCTHAEVHDVHLDDDHCRHDLFDYFLFCNTDFHDFDFAAHKEYLARNNWQIHAFAASDHLHDEREEFAPATLENTYLKAKTCASDFGDRKAAAEFFIKEMLYRRKKNWEAAFTREATVSPINRAKALGKWFGNNVLHQTCGYGERLWRVVYVSAVAVVLWGLLYATVSQGTTASRGLAAREADSLLMLFTPEGLVILGENMYFSMVTFTTLGYGDIQPVGPTARSLAGLEAFFGALLVALVVFVLGRRVAW